MNNINKHGIIYRGSNPVTDTAKDTVSTWVNFGPGIWMFSPTGKVNNKPSEYGLVLSLCQKLNAEIHQIWFVQPSGNVYHRGGNSSGWSGTWKLFSPGTANTAQVLSGYTFSSANGSNLSGSIKNYSNVTQTATTSTSDTTKTCYQVRDGYIAVVPAIGYWGSWNFDNCIRVPAANNVVKHLSGWINASTSTYPWQYQKANGEWYTDNMYYLTLTFDFSHRVVCATAHHENYGNNQHLIGINGQEYQLGRSTIIQTQKTHPTMTTDTYFYIAVDVSGGRYFYEAWYV